MKTPTPVKRADGTWAIQLRINGRSKIVKADTKSACIRQANLIKAKLKQEQATITQPVLMRTVGDLTDEFIQKRSQYTDKCAPSTLRYYAEIRRNRFRDLWERKIYTVKDWQFFIDQEADLVSPKTLANSWHLITAAFKAAHLDIPKVILPSVKKKNDHPYLTFEQIPIFMDAIKGKPYEIPALLALSGMRRSEVYALYWEDINFDKNLIHIHSAKVLNKDNQFETKSTKTAAGERYVPIFIPRLSELLRENAKTDGLIVTTSPNSLYKRLECVYEKAGLPNCGVHGLRHSAASLMAHLNVPQDVAMRIGGWDDIETMRKIYTHVAEQDISFYGTAMQDYFTNAQ